MNILITICARGGSKGVPRKNIKLLNGIPLISYTIKKAKLFSKEVDADIAVSSDDMEIIRVAENEGIETNYVRPTKLAKDYVSKIDVIRDLLKFEETIKNLKYKYIIDLDVTSPLRTLKDLKESFDIFKKNSQCLTLFSVNNSSRNPYFNMVEPSKKGFVNIVKQTDQKIISRQQAPIVYDMNASFCWFRREFFDLNSHTPVVDKSMVYLFNHICFDIDNQIDFDFMEYLISEGKLDFEL